jgi:hypothetical protein
VKTYTIEFYITLPDPEEGWCAQGIETLLYKQGLKHFPYDWGTGKVLAVEDYDEE